MILFTDTHTCYDYATIFHDFILKKEKKAVSRDPILSRLEQFR